MEITKLMNQSSKLSLIRPMPLIQQLELWKALDFRGKFLTVANVSCIFKARFPYKLSGSQTHVFKHVSFKLFAYAFVLTLL